MPRSPARAIVFLLVVIGFLILPSAAFAMHARDTFGADGDSLSIRGSFGLLEGKAGEYVYDTDRYGQAYTASELDWDLSGLAVAGAVVSGKLSGRWAIHAGFWTCVNQGSGQMFDYDWHGGGQPWTDRSISDVSVVSSYMADLNVTFEVLQQPHMRLSTVVGYKQDFWKWEDSVVDFLYSENGFRDYHEVGDGSRMVDYEQRFSIPYFGVDSDWRWSAFRLNAYLLYSPFVMAEDKDYHIMRDLHFKETFSFGSYIGLGVAGQYDITPAVFLSALLDIQTIPEFTGDMEVTDETGETTTYPASAGISHTSGMISASVGVRF